MEIKYMKEALKEAQKSTYDIPVGAIIVYEDEILARAHNLTESNQDPTDHAEIIAIKEASKILGSWRLLDCAMYVSLEPCPMCAGAIINSRIKRLVIGARDPKRGCCGSVYNLVDNANFNHRVELVTGVMEDESRKLLQDFFRKRRK